MKLSRRLIPDVTTLQAFECAARHGSFTQAAHELNLTQSAVSRQIKDLEEQLGVLLFERAHPLCGRCEPICLLARGMQAATAGTSVLACSRCCRTASPT